MAERTRKPAAKDVDLTFRGIMSRRSWQPLPSVAIAMGNADFLKALFVKRFTRELFGEREPEVRRFQGPAGERQIGDLPLSTVLDELHTPSFFSRERLIIVERADAFLGEHGEALLPFLDHGFAGGHLILVLAGKLDGRTKFAKAVKAKAWVIDCPQPYDRPPPWDPNTPAWESELTAWVVAQAKEKGLTIDSQTAFLFHERAGTDLAILDEEMEKLATYLSGKGTGTVDAEAVAAVVGDLREDSVFVLVERFLEGRAAEALDVADRLFRKGYATDRGPRTMEPIGIALLFIGALIPRLRALRRAHAVAADGGGPQKWVELGIIQRPFLPRFERQMAVMSPPRIAQAFERLYEVDKAMKSGGEARELIELFIAGNATRPRDADPHRPGRPVSGRTAPRAR